MKGLVHGMCVSVREGVCSCAICKGNLSFHHWNEPRVEGRSVVDRVGLYRIQTELVRVKAQVNSQYILP